MGWKRSLLHVCLTIIIITVSPNFKTQITQMILNICIRFVLFSESEMKDVCLSVSNNVCASSQNGNEETAVQNKPSKVQQNQRHSSQNHRYHRPPPVVTDEEYSDSSIGLYNDYVSNNSVSVWRKKPNIIFIL